MSGALAETVCVWRMRGGRSPAELARLGREGCGLPSLWFPHVACWVRARGRQVWALSLLSVFLLPPDRLLCSGHDVSDGGLVTCLLEMAFAGNCGIEVDVPAPGVDGEEPGVWTRAWVACRVGPVDPMSYEKMEHPHLHSLSPLPSP